VKLTGILSRKHPPSRKYRAAMAQSLQMSFLHLFAMHVPVDLERD
jgi:hypothetical protein